MVRRFLYCASRYLYIWRGHTFMYMCPKVIGSTFVIKKVFLVEGNITLSLLEYWGLWTCEWTGIKNISAVCLEKVFTDWSEDHSPQVCLVWRNIEFISSVSLHIHFHKLIHIWNLNESFFSWLLTKFLKLGCGAFSDLNLFMGGLRSFRIFMISWLMRRQMNGVQCKVKWSYYAHLLLSWQNCLSPLEK